MFVHVATRGLELLSLIVLLGFLLRRVCAAMRHHLWLVALTDTVALPSAIIAAPMYCGLPTSLRHYIGSTRWLGSISDGGKPIKRAPAMIKSSATASAPVTRPNIRWT